MSDDGPEWVSQLRAEVLAEAEARAADPVGFLVEILRHYWMDNTAEEADRLWRTTVRDRPAYAVDVLNCLYATSEAPPSDLADVVPQRGGVIWYDETARPPRPFDAGEYAAWLRQVHDRWAAIYEQGGPH